MSPDLSKLFQRTLDNESDETLFNDSWHLFGNLIVSMTRHEFQGWANREDLARSAAQEAILKLFLHRNDYDGRRVENWIYEFAFNAVRNIKTDLGRQKNRYLKLKIDPLQTLNHETPLAKVETQETNIRVHNALSRLSLLDQAILTLHYFEEFSFEEIASLLSFACKRRASEACSEARQRFSIAYIQIIGEP